MKKDMIQSVSFQPVPHDWCNKDLSAGQEVLGSVLLTTPLCENHSSFIPLGGDHF